MNEPSVVRRVDWRELFPWLILLRVFRVAIVPGNLMHATIALLLCSLGWWLSGSMFLKKDEFKNIPPPYLTGAAHVPVERRTTWIPPAAAEYLPAQTGRILLPLANLTEPAVQLFDDQTPRPYVAYYLFGLLFSAAVWAYAGGVISRQALLELGTEQQGDQLDASRFVLRRYWHYFLAPLAPLLAIVFLGLMFVPLGWIMLLKSGVVFAGLVWVIVVGVGLLAAWLMLGVLFGWPMMFGAVGSRRDGDALQAFSDVYSYVYGKPLHYFFYVVVAVSLGVLALTLVQIFAEVAVNFGFWATSWGAGGARIGAIKAALNAPDLGQRPDPLSEVGSVRLIGLVLTLVNTIVHAAAYSYFFVASTAIFLLMRLAVDEKEMDEVHLEEDEVQLETARRARLSDEIPPEKPAPVPPPEPLPPETVPPIVTSETVIAPEIPPELSPDKPVESAPEESSPEKHSPEESR
jgi:hypothetical protein